MRNPAAVALTATISGQIAVAMAIMTIPVLTPQISREIEIDASKVGLYSAIVFTGAISFTSIAGSVIDRYGAVRTTQIALAVSSLGLIISTLSIIPALIVGAFATGMGYGIATPAASNLLARTVEAKRRGLIFSIKQSGVPIGGFLLGLTVPQIAQNYGWVTGVISVSLTLLILAAFLQIIRNYFDKDLDKNRKISPYETLEALKLAFSDPRLRPLAVSSFVYAMMQLSIFTYFVVFLVEKVHFTPVLAGFVFSIMHLGGTFGRPLLGWVSDRILPARPLLSLVGFCIFFCSLALVSLNNQWPFPSIIFLAAITGLITAGWNGVYISEIARVVDSKQIGRATGGVSAFTFFGVAIGPAVFSGVLEFSGDYTAPLLLLGIAALGPALLLMLKSPKKL